MPSLQVGAIVLCGGQSRRMGRAKELLPFGDEYLLQRIVRIIGGVVHPVVVAARVGQEVPPLPQEIMRAYDRIPDRGPLEGIAVGLDALSSRCEAALVTTCDHPLLCPEVVTRLIELLGDHLAVVPEHDGYLFPLLAVYRVSVRPIVEELLASSDRAVKRLVERSGARIIPARMLCNVDPNLDSFQNVNDPASYELSRILQSSRIQSGGIHAADSSAG